MNPVLQATIDHINAGRQITRITVDDRISTSTVIFEFADNSEDELSINANRETFMGWWRQTGVFIREKGLSIRLDSVDSADTAG